MKSWANYSNRSLARAQKDSFEFRMDLGVITLKNFEIRKGSKTIFKNSIKNKKIDQNLGFLSNPVI
jgi:hypothetical protein